MQTPLALSPLIIRILEIVVPVVIGLLLLPIIAASAILNKSTVIPIPMDIIAQCCSHRLGVSQP